MSIATRTGDDGTTSLIFNRRVLKTHVRVVANGALDELNAALGLVRAQAISLPEYARLASTLYAVQKHLVTIMGEVGVLPEDRERYLSKGYPVAQPEMLTLLDAEVHHLEEECHLSFEHWATPGATPLSAACDFARTVCRRAEREVVALQQTGVSVPSLILQFLNRLSDLCFLYARYAEG